MRTKEIKTKDVSTNILFLFSGIRIIGESSERIVRMEDGEGKFMRVSESGILCAGGAYEIYEE